MKPKSKGGDRIADEAARWVVELTEKPNRQTRARFRVWARCSTRHWEQFLIAAALYRAFQGVDRRRSIDVEDLLCEAQATVLRWKTDPSTPASPACREEIDSESRRLGAARWSSDVQALYR